jgi:hypothetical protein
MHHHNANIEHRHTRTKNINNDTVERRGKERERVPFFSSSK